MVCVLLIAERSGRADHAHVARDDRAGLAASLSLVAARFDTMLYGGDYEGVVPALRWTHDRFAVGATAPLYRIEENGLQVLGAGDATIDGQVTIVHDEMFAAGATLALSAPTGDHKFGLGMGHPMVMPAVWGAMVHDRHAVVAALGYSVGFADAAHHHDDMMWPLVDPMNASELTWSARGDLAVARAWRLGAQLAGGVPVDASGVTRVIAGARAVWISQRVQTGLELQAGLAGDPFTLRAVAQTTVAF